jgi:hypothetical protein
MVAAWPHAIDSLALCNTLAGVIFGRGLQIGQPTLCEAHRVVVVRKCLCEMVLGDGTSHMEAWPPNFQQRSA